MLFIISKEKNLVISKLQQKYFPETLETKTWAKYLTLG